MIGALLQAGRLKIAAATVILIALTALADWLAGTKVTLEALYIVPMIVAGVALQRWEIGVCAVVCTLLRAQFETPEMKSEIAFAAVAYFSSGLFVSELVRNHRQTIQHLQKVEQEQALREQAEARIRALVESSPAAILTVDPQGVVIAANHAADRLFLGGKQTLEGRSIAGYLPILAEALQVETGANSLRTSAQSQGIRESGDPFLAETWFSTYKTPAGTNLAAIVVDASEEMREREEQGLKQLFEGNSIVAAAMSHEVLNISGALKHLSAHVQGKYNLAGDPDFAGMSQLIAGLELIATFDIRSPAACRPIGLRPILDNLRIVIEPDWKDIDGTVKWRIPASLPNVVAEPHGLFQAMLNLARNSHRAVQNEPRRELSVIAQEQEGQILIRFWDTGKGVAAPSRLFEPFQKEAEGTGLGLHISRSILRSFGGDLRFEPQETGSCFVIELQAS